MSSLAAVWFIAHAEPVVIPRGWHSRATERLFNKHYSVDGHAAPTFILLCARSSSCSRHAGTCLMSVTPCPASHVAMGDVRLPSKMQYGVRVPMAAADLQRRVSSLTQILPTKTKLHATPARLLYRRADVLSTDPDTQTRANAHEGFVGLCELQTQGEGHPACQRRQRREGALYGFRIARPSRHSRTRHH